MAAMDRSKWVYSVLLGACLTCLVSADKTPVFLWTTESTVPKVQVPPVGQHLSQSSFKDSVINHLENAKGNIVAFLQDKLHMNDITKYAGVYDENSNGDAFHNLKRAIESHSSIELPSVHDVASTINDLSKQFKGKVHEVVDPADAKKLPLDGATRHLVIIHLPTNDIADELRRSLQRNDGIMGEISAHLAALGKPYTALYTGKTSQGGVAPETLYFGRHLLEQSETAARSNSSFFDVKGCLFHYMKDLEFTLLQRKPAEGESKETVVVLYRILLVANNTDLSYTGRCGNKTAQLSFSATGRSLEKFTVSMDFAIGRFEWKVENFTLEYIVTDDNNDQRSGNHFMDIGDVGAARQFSYHCTDPEAFVQTNASDISAVLKYHKIQLQPVDIKNGKFSPPDDCVGFFSIPILSGLVAAVVLTMILAFGVIMIMNITTMDRFDDPKGKTITVNVNE